MRKISSYLCICLAVFAIMFTMGIKPVSVEASTTQGSASISNAVVTRSADSSNLTISWNNAGNLGDLKVYVSTNPDKPMVTLLKTIKLSSNSTKGSITFPDPTPGYRSYYDLVSSKGPDFMVAERTLSLKGVPNGRDLGGYKTTDGKYVKWGYLFRTAQLNGATADDVLYLNRMNIKTVIDLRITSEVQKNPDVQIPLVQEYPINLFGDDYIEIMMKQFPNLNWPLISNKTASAAEIVSFMTNLYDFEASSPVFASGEKQFFTFMLTNDKPVLWHCTYGKDRTGTSAALLLYALGVPKDTIMDNYLLTNQEMQDYYPDMYKSMGKDLFIANQGVESTYLQTFFNDVTAKYGSIDNYLAQACGINNTVKAELRAKYLQSTP